MARSIPVVVAEMEAGMDVDYIMGTFDRVFVCCSILKDNGMVRPSTK
jgi:hypothetical protein